MGTLQSHPQIYGWTVNPDKDDRNKRDCELPTPQRLAWHQPCIELRSRSQPVVGKNHNRWIGNASRGALQDKPRARRRRNVIAAAKSSVLIVDNHPLIRHGLAKLIGQEEDLEVCGQVGGVEEAVKAVERLQPALAIVEISPGGGDGFELVKRIRAAWPRVLVLVLSMHSERLYAERALRAGARGYIMKEESPRAVMAAIRKILAGGVHVSENVQSLLVERVASGKNTPGRASVETLSDRELDVLRLIGSGFGTRRIAEHLQRSVKTISPIGRTSRTSWASRAPSSWSSTPRFGCSNSQPVNT